MKHLNRLSRLALTGLLMTAAAEGAAGGTATPEAPAAAAVPEVKAPGVGDKAKELIRSGLGNKEVLEGIKAAFPESKTSMASVNWYRNHLRGLGEDVKTARELSAATKPTAEQIAADKAKAKAEKDAKKEADKKEKADKKAAEKAAAKQAKADADAAAAANAAPAATGEQPVEGEQPAGTDGAQPDSFLE
jgi:hypothetical protein